MNLNAVMDAIGDRLGIIAGLRIYDYPADKIAAPAAVLGLPDDITYDDAYGRGMDRMSLPLLLVVGRGSDRVARDDLAAYASGSGTRSIKQVLESGTYVAFDTLRVTRVEFDSLRIAGVDHLAALFDLDIAGSGS